MRVVCLLLLLTPFMAEAERRASLRTGKGGVGGEGLIAGSCEGESGPYRQWTQDMVSAQHLGKRIHYLRGEESYSGKVINVYAFIAVDDTHGCHIRVKLVVDAILDGNREETADGATGSQVIDLRQVGGTLIVGHRHIGSSIRVSYDVPPAGEIKSPADMFVRNYPNMIVGIYSDGYLEVMVSGHVFGDKSTSLVSGAVFIHIDDIVTDWKMDIIPAGENQLSNGAGQ